MSNPIDVDDSQLLKQQEEFLRSKSHVKRSVHFKPTKKSSEKLPKAPVIEVVETDESQPILGNIVEKSFGPVKFEFKPSSASAVAFPVAKHRFVDTSVGQKELPDEHVEAPTCSKSGEDIGQLLHEIQKENEQKLAAMSSEEIVEMQQQLMAKLDPSLISFLKCRKTGKATTSFTQEEKCCGLAAEGSSSSTKFQESSVKLDDLIPNLSPNWLHMDSLETEKLKWTRPITVNNTEQPSELVTARFDLEGSLMSADSRIPVTSGLHHHGEEESRPGYSIDELLPMCRSTALNQRLLAMSVLAKIAHLAKIGVYDTALKDSVLQKLLDMGICTIIRHQLDQPGLSEITGAIHLLYSLLYQPYDEALLDRTFNWFGGCLQRSLKPTDSVGMETDDGGAALTDEQWASADTVKGLIKMDLLRRLRYILEVLDPPESAVSESLKIFIRLARHSPEICQQIVECPRLVDLLRTFLSFEYDRCGRSYLTLKLIRVVCSSDRRIVERLLAKCEVVDFIVRWIVTEDCGTAVPEDFCCLVLECYRTLCIIGWYGHGLDLLSDLFPVLTKQLMQVFSVADLGKSSNQYSMERASCLLRVVTTAAIKEGSYASECLKGYGECAEAITCWLLQAWKSLANKPPQGSFTELLMVCFECLSSLYRCKLTIKGKDDVQKLLSTELPSIVSTYGALLNKCSLLQSDAIFAYNRDPKSLPSVLSTVKDASGLCPLIVGTFSPFPLLCGLTSMLESFEKTPMDSCELMCPPVIAYLDGVNQPTSQLHNISHPCLRHELYFLYWLSIRSIRTSKVPPAAVVLVALVQEGDQKLAEDLMTKILKALMLPESVTLLCESEIISDEQFHKLKSHFVKPTDSVSPDASLTGMNGRLFDDDWLFLPLRMVRKQFDSQESQMIPELSSDQIEVVRLNLIFVLRLLTQQPSLIGKFISQTSLLVSVAEVFLFGRDTFTDSSIQRCLNKFLEIFVPFLETDSLSLDETCSKTPVFYDFYKALLEEFEATSFGDSLFSQFLLLPLFSFNVAEKCRNLLWSTERTSVYLIRLDKSKMLIPSRLIAQIGTSEQFAAAIENNLITRMRNGDFYDLVSASLSRPTD